MGGGSSHLVGEGGKVIDDIPSDSRLNSLAFQLLGCLNAVTDKGQEPVMRADYQAVQPDVDIAAEVVRQLNGLGKANVRGC